MPFVSKDLPTFIYVVFVWGADASAHQNHRLFAAKTVIHSSLEAGANRQTHFDVRNDVAWMEFIGH